MISGFELVNKVVVITGAAGGLGREFALGFANAGAKILVADLEIVGATETVELIKAAGGQAAAVHVDVTSRESTDAMAKATIDSFGRIDVLVNNAAIYATLRRTKFTDIDSAEWDRVMNVNVKGAWNASSSVYPIMTQPGGSIVNIASATVFSGSPLWMHYVASKAALIGITRVMAKEVGTSGVRVNAIAPGFTLTDASLSLMDDAETYGIERGALRRASQPQDILGAAMFLASIQSDYITGQTIVVDGGKQFI
jgi:NAD(P)-dependent dehydrogenase (short-subunit alcohol dehydrogenase family)